MRPIERIDVITDKLNEAWKLVPDMRFWQFLSFLFEYTPEETQEIDTFFWEDNITEEMLDKLISHFK